MSNKVQKILVAVAFAGVAGHAMACGSTPCNNGGTTLNLNSTNNNSLTANPNATATGGVASANNNSANTNTLTANPNATANGGTATVNNSPVTTVTANPTANATANGGAGGAGGNGYGGSSTSNSTANGGTGYGGAGYGGSANQGQSQYQGQTTTVGNENNITNTNTATTGASTSQASIATGAVANNISYSSTYKAAASTATAAGVIGQGHGCFEHKGGFGLGVQVMTAGVSGNYNQGETYNKDCAGDQAALIIVGKTGSPVHDALAVQTAANMSPEVGQALETVKSTPSLVGLFAVPVAAAAPAPAVRVKPVVEDATVVQQQGKLQSINCGKKPTMYDSKTNTLYCGHDFK